MIWVYGFLDLLLGSPVDFPLMLIGGEYLPHPPDFSNISPGSSYHLGKGVWSELLRTDGEYWSKLIRFVLWWTLALKGWKWSRKH